MIKEIRGNLFDTSAQVLVNTVNCKGVMGKGLALEFKYRYPEMFKAYVKTCENGELRPGKLMLWKETTPWILNFPTKDDWKQPSRISYIKKGLEEFEKKYKEWNIRSIAFPLLGTQQGGLNPQEVVAIMKEHFSRLKDIEIYIVGFDPDARDLLFEKIKNEFENKTEKEIEQILTIRPKQARLLRDALRKKKRMIELVQIKGLGEKTIIKLYQYAMNPPHRSQRKLGDF